MVLTSVTKPVIYKIVFMGDSGVGKSSIATRIATDTFSSCSDATIGASYFGKIIERDGQLYKFNIWDTAGQEKYSCLVPLYYRNCDAAIIVYDMTNRISYKNAIDRIPMLRNDSNVSVILLVGNKSDMEKTRMIATDEAKSYCEENDVLFDETSAKLNINVRELLHKIIDKMPPRKPEEKPNLPNIHFVDRYKLSCC